MIRGRRACAAIEPLVGVFRWRDCNGSAPADRLQPSEQGRAQRPIARICRGRGRCRALRRRLWCAFTGGAATAVAREPPKHGLERTRQRLNNRSHEIRASPTTCVGRRTTRRGPVDFRTDDQPRFALGRLGEAWCGPPRTVARPMGRQKHGGLLRGAAGARRLVDHGTRASARALSRPAGPAGCAACRRGARLVTRQAAPSRFFTAQPSRVHGRQPACPFRKLVQTDGDSDA